MYPVYSFSKKILYYNRHCALCNDANDSIPWDVVMNCNSSDTLTADFLQDGLESGLCQVIFRPPDLVSVDKFICRTDVIASSNTTRLVKGIDKEVEEACASVRATVKYEGASPVQTYANVFCKLCNEVDHLPENTCKAEYDLFVSKSYHDSFMALVDWEVFESGFHDKESIHKSGRYKSRACGKNEIKHPTKVSTNVYFTVSLMLSNISPRLAFVGSIFSFCFLLLKTIIK